MVRVRRRITKASLAAGFLLCSCRPPIGNAIIAEYSRASCVALSDQPKIHPPTREWDASLSLKNRMQVVVTASDAVGGVVSLRDVTSGKSWTAINPGDYIYPSDIRLDLDWSPLLPR